jgi:glycerate-2-kinase
MRLSRVKGGGLRRRIRKGPVFTGIWCDVAPEDFRIVGSAPTLSVPARPDAEEILARVGLSIPRPLPPDRTLRRAPTGDRRALLASGRDLESDTVSVLRELGHRARALHIAEGTDAGLFAARLRKLAQEASVGRWAWVTSGEVSTPAGGGRGGRCSHLAALVALELVGLRGWTFAALATDGTDGTGDGGAWVSPDALPPQSEICRCVAGGDTATLWASWGTGMPRKPTGNNLRDLYVLTVDR